MNLTIEDYERALDGFIDDVKTMEDDAMSVLLFGSMARGEVVPGQSDVMDAYIVLNPEVFEDRERFMSCLNTMMRACHRLQETGLPFHPFAYIGRDEVEYLPDRAFSLLPFEPLTKTVWGKNFLPEVKETATERLLNQTRFFEARNIVHFQLARFLKIEVLTELECQIVIPLLLSMKKNTYMAYMAIFGKAPSKFEPIEELAAALPGLDVSVLRRIKAVKESLNSMVDFEEVRSLVKDSLIYMEDLHRRVLEKLNAQRSEAN